MATPIIDYTTLTAYLVAVFDRAGDTVFVAQTDQFIASAEDTFTPQLLNRRMETVATLTTATDGSVALPADFYRIRSVTATINGVNTLLPPLGPAAIPGNYPITTGDPTSNYYISGSTLYSVPATGSLAIVMDYWAKFTPITSGSPTNWLLTNYSSLYQFATMEQAAIFNQDWQDAAMFGQKAKAILTEITDFMALDYYNTSEVNMDTVTP
jgi:hypothetical protein